MMTASPFRHAAAGTTMRAAVLTGVGRIEVRPAPRAPRRAHEVAVRVSAVGLCGTDFHIVRGHANYNRDPAGNAISLTTQPQILGHEIAGVVEALGSAVHGLAPGDRVVIDQGRTCVSEGLDACEYCISGDSHQCERYREHGITGLPGGFAEEIVIPAANVVRVTSAIDLAEAAMTEPLGCVVHASETLLRSAARYALAGGAAARRIRAVVIIGGGPAGLLFTQHLRNAIGYDGLLLVSEPGARKRALAARFGAEVVDPAAECLADVVHRRTHGRRAELVIDASGAAEAFTTIPRILRKQGTVLLYGHGHGGADLSVLSALQFLEPTLLSPVGASGGFEPDGRPTTYVRALRLLEHGTIDVASLLSHRYTSLDDVPRAFAGDHRAPDYVKGVVLL